MPANELQQLQYTCLQSRHFHNVNVVPVCFPFAKAQGRNDGLNQVTRKRHPPHRHCEAQRFAPKQSMQANKRHQSQHTARPQPNETSHRITSLPRTWIAPRNDVFKMFMGSVLLPMNGYFFCLSVYFLCLTIRNHYSMNVNAAISGLLGGPPSTCSATAVRTFPPPRAAVVSRR